MDGVSDDELAMEVEEQTPASPAEKRVASQSRGGGSSGSGSSSSGAGSSSNSSSGEDEDEEEEAEDGNAQRNTQTPPSPRAESPASSASSSQKEPPAPVVTRHEIEMPAARPKLGIGGKPDLYHVKLPNFLSIGTHEYDPLHYEDEIDDEVERDYEGRAKLKLKVENTIRWRKFKEDDGTEKIESNTRLVEWSDGTKSLYLGGEVFDVNVKPVGESSQLYIRLGQAAGLQAQAIFKSKLSIRPNSTESSTHRKLTLSLADRSQKTQKIKIWNNYGEDPEVKLQRLSKNEEEKMKAAMRRETKQRRLQERSQTGGPSAQYLEDYDEEDDDGSISLSAIKRNVARRGDDYSDDEDDSAEEEEESDDSDPEFGKERRTAERKKKVVIEDDSDED